jgi:NDP-sugar pyrophosphorylase family protein
MRAMLLCAGLSTRLGKLGAECPKPLLPVCGMPILHYGIANLVAHGIKDLVINTHHRADLIEQVIGDGSQLGARVRYSHEPKILGTGGGLKHALHLLDPEGTDEPFISVNGKLIFDLDFTALVDAFMRAGEDVLGMMVVRRVPDAKTWGAVDVRFDDRGPFVTNVLGDGEHMFCGVHVTRPSVMARLPDGESDSIRQGYLPWMHEGGRVAAYEHEHGYFAEHSTPERYLESNIALVSGTPLRNPPGPLSGVDPSATIDPRAKIVEPVRICAGAAVVGPVTVGPLSIVGPNARIERDFVRSVAWANATANAGNAAETIVT